MKYFEITFGNPENECARVCIMGLRQPTIEEAADFCRKDAEYYRLPMTGVLEISKNEAEADYAFVEDLPVFGE